jgi:hypothetical protein
MKVDFIKAAEQLAKYNRLREQADQAMQRVKEHLGQETTNGLCYSMSDCDLPGGKPGQSVRLEVALAEYLTRWPNAEPTPRTFVYEGRTRVYMEYPDRHIGYGKGVSVWVSARTPAKPLAIPEPQVAQNATAKAADTTAA